MVITSASRKGKAFILSPMEGLELANSMGALYYTVKEPSICPMALSTMVVGSVIRRKGTVCKLQAMDRSKVSIGIKVYNRDENILTGSLSPKVMDYAMAVCTDKAEADA